jgi:glycosyltransferase involved in cell wall biosynthesis
MRRLANSILVYTESQALELMDHDPRLQVVVAPNALYRKAEMIPVRSSVRGGFIYVGRLVREKKVQLLIEALGLKAVKGIALHHLHIVGDGPERTALEAAARKLGVEDYVTFYGHVSDRDSLRSIYGLCLGAVSPGYVGLSITQALGFGVPMIIADNEPHAPEIEASKPGFNSIYFRAGNVESLAEAMRLMTSEKDYWIKSSDDISADCRTRYSAEVMAERFIECAQLATKQ